MKKKLMATLLALALVMSLVPTVFASSGEKKVCTPAGDGTQAVVGNEQCDASSHLAGCPKKCQSTDSECDKTITKGNYCADHQPKTPTDPEEPSTPPAGVACTGKAADSEGCTATTHKGACTKACTNAADCNLSGGKGGSHKASCPGVCTGNSDTCQKEGNTGHTGRCNKNCTEAADCPATVHKAGCAGVCTGDDTDCQKTGTAGHKSTCNKGCTEAANCTHGTHKSTCVSLCTGRADCTATNHKKVTVNAAEVNICLSQCTAGTACTNAAGYHKATCPKGCTGAANCTQSVHMENCVSLCTMSANCDNTGDHHKADCVKLCTFGKSVTVDGVTYTQGETCPNTSGNPSVHMAGCVKATVSDSVVLDPNGNPVESEKPTESQPTEITKAEDFSDVNAGDWFAADLTTVVEKGWIKGNEDGSFDPEGEVSGQQAVVFVSRMLGKDLVTTGENWADEATAWAAEDGLTEGIEITSEGIARKDLILLLWRAAGKHTSDHEISFSDVDELEGDYLTALKWAVENGIIMGNDDGTAAPHAATSRSEISVILVRYDKAVNK